MTLAKSKALKERIIIFALGVILAIPSTAWAMKQAMAEDISSRATRIEMKEANEKLMDMIRENHHTVVALGRQISEILGELRAQRKIKDVTSGR